MKQKPIKNKKGALTDLFVFMIGAFVLVIAVVILYYAVNVTNEKLHENIEIFDKVLEGSSENATKLIDKTFGKVPTAYQSLKWITFMLIVGMMLSILITSFLVRTNPVFFIAYILIVVIAIVVSVPMSNTYEVIYQNPTLSSSFDGFWGQTYIFLNLPIWITIIGIFAGIVMFVNMLRTSQYGGYA